MKSLNMTVRHLRALFLILKKDFGLVYISYRKRDIQELKVSERQESTRSLSIPSAQETVLRQ
jgi:hypothetical protein